MWSHSDASGPTGAWTQLSLGFTPSQAARAIAAGGGELGSSVNAAIDTSGDLHVTHDGSTWYTVPNPSSYSMSNIAIDDDYGLEMPTLTVPSGT